MMKQCVRSTTHSSCDSNGEGLAGSKSAHWGWRGEGMKEEKQGVCEKSSGWNDDAPDCEEGTDGIRVSLPNFSQ